MTYTSATIRYNTIAVLKAKERSDAAALLIASDG